MNKRIIELMVENIASIIHHGECFYKDDEKEYLLANIDKLKEKIIEYDANKE